MNKSGKDETHLDQLEGIYGYSSPESSQPVLPPQQGTRVEAGSKGPIQNALLRRVFEDYELLKSKYVNNRLVKIENSVLSLIDQRLACLVSQSPSLTASLDSLTMEYKAKICTLLEGKQESAATSHLCFFELNLILYGIEKILLRDVALFYDRQALEIKFLESVSRNAPVSAKLDTKERDTDSNNPPNYESSNFTEKEIGENFEAVEKDPVKARVRSRENSRRTGNRFSKQSSLILNEWLDAHPDHTELSSSTLKLLTESTGLNEKQVVRWISNHRHTRKKLLSKTSSQKVYQRGSERQQ